MRAIIAIRQSKARRASKPNLSGAELGKSDVWACADMMRFPFLSCQGFGKGPGDILHMPGF